MGQQQNMGEHGECWALFAGDEETMLHTWPSLGFSISGTYGYLANTTNTNGLHLAAATGGDW